MTPSNAQRMSFEYSDNGGYEVPPATLSTSIAPTSPAAALGALDPNPKLSMALTLVWDGIPVFPVWSVADNGTCGCGQPACRDSGKHPVGALVPRGFHAATCNLYQVVSWWDRIPAPNIGMPTGSKSGIVVLDIDRDSGGFDSLNRLIEQFGPFPETWAVETGGGGRHVYFRHPRTRVPSGVNTLGSGLDVRADGAYVIVPPSKHRSGNHYRWSADGRPDVVSLAPLPAWLIDLLVANRQQPKRQGHEPIATNEAIPEGARNDTLARIAGAMRRRGCSEAAILAALLTENDQRCQPPLPESEVERIARSIASYPPSPTLPIRRPSRAQQFTPFAFRGGKAESW